MLMIVLWASAILSAIVDNIPFVAVMIPILKDLVKTEPFASDPKNIPFLWALALGACLGGNGSQIGASANVVSTAIANQKELILALKNLPKNQSQLR